MQSVDVIRFLFHEILDPGKFSSILSVTKLFVQSFKVKIVQQNECILSFVIIYKFVMDLYLHLSIIWIRDFDKFLNLHYFLFVMAL